MNRIYCENCLSQSKTDLLSTSAEYADFTLLCKIYTPLFIISFISWQVSSSINKLFKRSKMFEMQLSNWYTVYRQKQLCDADFPPIVYNLYFLKFILCRIQLVLCLLVFWKSLELLDVKIHQKSSVYLGMSLPFNKDYIKELFYNKGFIKLLYVLNTCFFFKLLQNH